MKLFGISIMQYLVLIVSLILVFFIMREAELRETVLMFSDMIQLTSEWINNPQDVATVQHEDEVDYLAQMYKKKGLRFTLIRGDGVVLLDGAMDHKKMENHLNRPEIQDALVYGRGVSIRHSKTLDKMMLYVAEPIKTSYGTLYLRLAATPDIIQHDRITYTMMTLVAITGVVMVKLCS